jgi:hypothetical protein
LIKHLFESVIKIEPLDVLVRGLARNIHSGITTRQTGIHKEHLTEGRPLAKDFQNGITKLTRIDNTYFD